ncbi:MAG: ABC transporter permease [Tenericutes bacterium]|nr:ABC transporter permease [Mycoplasmatota bacterium]
MTVFNTFWKIIKKYKGTIILYTVMLIVFGGLNTTTNDTGIEFSSSKPDILIVNNDKYEGITKNLVDYLTDNSNMIDIKDDESARDDALFYRDISYIIYIPKNYRIDTLNGKNVELEIKKVDTYDAALTEMMLSRYIETQNIYLKTKISENELINNINESLKNKTNVEIISKLNTDKLTSITRYFNFASYSIMAVTIYIICLVITSFHEQSVNKRIIISSMNYKKHNRLLLLSSSIYAIVVWGLYTLLGFIILGNELFSIRGLLFIGNEFVFTMSCLTLSLLISSLVSSKVAVSGIVNVVALGSAFLCGAFIPLEWLPSSVIKIAHILPAYYFISSNETIKTLEIINTSTLHTVFINTAVILAFTILFTIINNIVIKKKRVIA